MRIGDLLNVSRQRLIVGREKELSLMRTTLAEEDRDWQLLHFYGPGGIGKTTLLHRYQGESGAPLTLYFDGHSGFHRPEDYLNKLQALLASSGICRELPLFDRPEEAADLVNQLAQSRGILVMLLDTFELWGALAEWLRETWLPSLVPNVRICTTGRYPLDGPWLLNGWSYLVRNEQLAPLPREAVCQYAGARGIADVQWQDDLMLFSQGHPLAVSLACEVMLEQGPDALWEHAKRKKAIGPLIQDWMRDIREPLLPDYLDAASLLWTFDQDLLQVVLDQSIDLAAFRELCGLPFVTVREEGWSLHDSVRNLLSADFQHRKPDTFRLYRRRALVYFKHEHRAGGGWSKRTLDKLYLHDNEFLRSYCLTGEDEGIEVRQALRDDIPWMERLCRQYYEAIGLVDLSLPLHSYIRDIWEADASSFITLWKGGRMVEFFSLIPLHAATREALSAIPLTAAYVRGAPQVPQAYLMFLMGRVPELEHVLSGPAWRIRLRQIISKAKSFVFLTPIPKWSDVVKSLGLQSLPEYEFRTDAGMRYYVYHLNLQAMDFDTHIDRLLDGVVSPDSAAIEPVPADALARWMKKVLLRYPVIESDVLRAGLNLLPQSPMASDRPPLDSRIRETLESAMERLSAGGREDAIFHQLLHLAYFHRIGSHEKVAERLQLPMATYYRYLKRGIARLAQAFLLHWR